MNILNSKILAIISVTVSVNATYANGYIDLIYEKNDSAGYLSEIHIKKELPKGAIAEIEGDKSCIDSVSLTLQNQNIIEISSYNNLDSQCQMDLYILLKNDRLDSVKLNSPTEETDLKPVDEIFYIVQPGDTISNIAEHYASKGYSHTKRLYAILKANNMNIGDVIKPGDKITIPGAEVIRETDITQIEPIEETEKIDFNQEELTELNQYFKKRG